MSKALVYLPTHVFSSSLFPILPATFIGLLSVLRACLSASLPVQIIMMCLFPGTNGAVIQIITILWYPMKMLLCPSPLFGWDLILHSLVPCSFCPYLCCSLCVVCTHACEGQRLCLLSLCPHSNLQECIAQNRLINMCWMNENHYIMQESKIYH